MTNNKALLYKLLNSGSCSFVLFFLQQHIANTEIGFRDGILCNKNLKYPDLWDRIEETPERWQRVEAWKSGRVISSHVLKSSDIHAFLQYLLSLCRCPVPLIKAPWPLISLPDAPPLCPEVQAVPFGMSCDCCATDVRAVSGRAWIVRSQVNLWWETVEESPKVMNQWPWGWRGFPDISHQDSLGGVCEPQRDREFRARFPHEASPGLFSTACSEHHGTTVHSAQKTRGNAWGPLQLALHLDSSIPRGPARCPSTMPGMTLITKSLFLEFVPVHHFPLHPSI